MFWLNLSNCNEALQCTLFNVTFCLNYQIIMIRTDKQNLPLLYWQCWSIRLWWHQTCTYCTDSLMLIQYVFRFVLKERLVRSIAVCSIYFALVFLKSLKCNWNLLTLKTSLEQFTSQQAKTIKMMTCVPVPVQLGRYYLFLILPSFSISELKI